MSFHGSDQILTPNIDALAYNGVIMNRFYTPPLCTPSRSSLMTGKYPTSLGMHHHVVVSDEPWGLGLEEKLLPEYFKDVGYKTHLVGKWHIGFFEQQYAPTRRGFDTFLGYLGPYIDYNNYTNIMLDRNYSRGYDMRKNLDVLAIDPKPYVTDLFNNEAVKVIKAHDEKDPLFLVVTHLAPHTGNQVSLIFTKYFNYILKLKTLQDNPLQAPQSEIDKFSHIRDPERQIYAGKLKVCVQFLIDHLLLKIYVN